MANDRLIPSLFNTRNIILFLIICWFFLVSLLPFSAFIFSERIPIIHPSIESTSNELVDLMKEEISSLKQQLVDLTRSTSSKIELTLNEALKIQTENYQTIQAMKTKQENLSQIINSKNLEIEELRKTLNGIENQPKETCPIPRNYDNELEIIKNKIDGLKNTIPNPDEPSLNKQSLTAISSIIPKVNNLIRSSNQKLSNLKSQCESIIEEKNKPLIVEVNYQMIENYIKDSISNCQERFAESCPKVTCPLPLPSISPSPLPSPSTNKESAPSTNTISLLKPDPSENFDHALPASGAKIVLEETSKTFFPNQYRLDTIIAQTMESLEIGYNYSDFLPPFSGQSILDFVGFDYGVGQVYEAVTPGTQLGNCWAIEGPKGELTIQLAKALKIKGITIDHISKKQAIDWSSAPRGFEIHAQSENDSTWRLLYQGIFDPKDKDHQYFPLSSFNGYSRSYRKVKLVILNNYGNKDFTCLYRFRVHDK